MTQLPLSLFQESVLLVPEQYDLFLGGGRGGGKSHALAFLAMRHGEQYDRRARSLYLRLTYKGLSDFTEITRDLFSQAYGSAARYNAHEGVWRLPNGAYFELGQYEKPGDYNKYQGRSFTMICVDEAGQYANPALIDKLRSNLRGPEGLPVRMILAANPGDVGHAWNAARYALKGTPWHPFYEEKSDRWWVSCPSVYTDNPFIDQESYRRELAAACPGDPELLAAWLTGNWAIARGAFFAGSLDDTRNAFEPWERLPDPWHPRGVWEYYLAHDYGYSAPSVTYLVAKSPGAMLPDGRWAPRDSLFLFDELATVVPGELNAGLQWPVAKVGEAIVAMCERWRVHPMGVADDAIFAQAGQGSIAEDFSRAGVSFTRAHKADRRTGWLRLKQLLLDAGSPDKPGLSISRACDYFWATVPFLARDPRKPDDVDSRGPDHAADAARYGCLYQRPHVGVVRLSGF